MWSMLIDDDLLRFCADKTKEIEARYDESCILPSEVDGYPRSVEDLDLIMQGLHKPIFHRQLRIRVEDAKFRSFYVPYADKYELYYVAGLTQEQIRYYKAKELLQIHLHEENLITRDIVSLVENMILRESPSSLDLDLGHPTTADTLGEIAAMQFLFPISRRIQEQAREGGPRSVTDVAREYGIPAFIVQRCYQHTQVLQLFF
jgi:hypothetical protein